MYHTVCAQITWTSQKNLEIYDICVSYQEIKLFDCSWFGTLSCRGAIAQYHRNDTTVLRHLLPLQRWDCFVRIRHLNQIKQKKLIDQVSRTCIEINTLFRKMYNCGSCSFYTTCVGSHFDITRTISVRYARLSGTIQTFQQFTILSFGEAHNSS